MRYINLFIIECLIKEDDIFFYFECFFYIILVVIMMRKKIYLVLLLLSLLFLTACSNPVDKFIKDVKKEVSNSIKNTSSKKIKESILYINDNYQKKIDKNFVYHT